MRKSAILSIVLIAGLSLAVAGCQSSSQSSSNSSQSSKTPNASSGTSTSNSNSGTFKLGSQAVKFSYYADNDRPDQAWGSDKLSQWITDNKKVSVTYVPSNGNAKQKYQTLIVGGNLPDLMNVTFDEVQDLVDSKSIIPLNQYLDKYPVIKNAVDPDVWNLLKSKDGKNYFLPNWFNSHGHANGNGGWIVNRKIYAELGSPKLETVQDLYNYLVLVKQKYPNVVPLEIQGDQTYFNGFKILYTAFGENRTGYYFDMRYYPQGNKLVSILKDPAFKDMVLYARKLFNEKLIDQDSFTEQRNQLQEKLAQGKVAVLADNNVFSSGRPANASLRKQDPKAGYDIIWPIHKEGLDKNKIFPNSYSRLGGGGVVITKNAKNPEGIYAYLDWEVSPDGQNAMWYGPPGIFWDKTDKTTNYPILNDKWNTLNINAMTKEDGIQSHMIIGNSKYIDDSKVWEDQQLPKDRQDWTTESQATVAWKTSFDITQYANTAPNPKSNEGIIDQNVSDIFNQAFAKMIYAKSDADAEAVMQKAQSDMDAAGYEKELQWQTQVWQQNLKTMGINK